MIMHKPVLSKMDFWDRRHKWQYIFRISSPIFHSTLKPMSHKVVNSVCLWMSVSTQEPSDRFASNLVWRTRYKNWNVPNLAGGLTFVEKNQGKAGFPSYCNVYNKIVLKWVLREHPVYAFKECALDTHDTTIVFSIQYDKQVFIINCYF